MTNKESEESIVTIGRALLHRWPEEERGINFCFCARKHLVLFKLFVVVLSVAPNHRVLCANRNLPDSRFKLNFRAVAIVLQSNRHGTRGNAKDKNLQCTCSCNDIFQNAVPVTSISGDIARSGAIWFQERMVTAKTFSS